ncbi:MAG TPA: glycoside hydrolase family 97 protein [bacterium]|nr:glycoside hydrolase family 97 protein [bacterium]
MFCLGALLSSCGRETSHHVVRSPDGQLAVTFRVAEDGTAWYRLSLGDSVILRDSRLGLVREDEDFSRNLSLASVSRSKKGEETYTLSHGKQRHHTYRYNRRVFSLENGSGRPMDVVFQVSDDGAAFRYAFPDSSRDMKKIVRENSEFAFLPGTKAFIQHIAPAKTGWSGTNPSYEEHYEPGIPVESLRVHATGWAFPALFQSGEFWVLLSETAPDRDYCGCRLAQDTLAGSFFIRFPEEGEAFPGGALNPESTLPWKTPWRILAASRGLRGIAESTLGTDLAAPSRLEDLSFIRPGRSSWSWVLLKDDSTVYDVQKRFIDYAAHMTWEYCLVDADWDRKIGYDGLARLAEYARTKDVGILVWYNSSGDWNTTPYTPKSKLLTREDRVREFSSLRDMGVKGVKVDFFAGDGQSMMAYYQDIFEDAAAFGLMVNCHGATLPRGRHRTYPNLVTVEAVRGFEFYTFDQTNADMAPTHSCFQPFTRNVFDPMDYTPVCFSEIPSMERVTTQGFELATSVIFWSGIQHFAETPKGMARVPEVVRDFMRRVPAAWDEMRFIDGFPGEWVALARRSGDIWYVAGIHGGETEREMRLDLSFLSGKKTGTLITDGADDRSFSSRKVSLPSELPFEIRLRPRGGFVMVF